MRVAPRLQRLVLLAVAAAGPGCRPANSPGPPPAPARDLAHFEGVLDESGPIYNDARSDLYGRAARALEAGDAAGAEALYRQAAVAYPADPDPYSRLGACLVLQERLEEARAEYGRALALDARWDHALYGLGCVAYKQGRDAEARDHLLRAVEAREGYGRAHRLLAFVYDRLGERAKARAHYERAAALDPKIAAEEYVRQRLAEPP